MIRDLLAWLAFIAILGGGFVAVLWLDQNVIEPAIARASARALGISVEQYRADRADFWQRRRWHR